MVSSLSIINDDSLQPFHTKEKEEIYETHKPVTILAKK